MACLENAREPSPRAPKESGAKDILEMRNVSWLSWLIFALSVAMVIVLTWNVDVHSSAGAARIAGSVIAVIVAVLTLANGARMGSRVTAIERGRYPRLRAGASGRIVARLQGELPQTVTIAAEGGDDIREVAAALVEALRAASWHVTEMGYGTLWNGGRGILISHTEAAASAATALIEALKAEGLPASDAGNPSTGNPVHIAFRRP